VVVGVVAGVEANAFCAFAENLRGKIMQTWNNFLASNQESRLICLRRPVCSFIISRVSYRRDGGINPPIAWTRGIPFNLLGKVFENGENDSGLQKLSPFLWIFGGNTFSPRQISHKARARVSWLWVKPKFWILGVARSPDSTGQISLVFYEIYRVGDSARCRMNFTQKGILACVF
jgi:hypothetical protein